MIIQQIIIIQVLTFIVVYELTNIVTPKAYELGKKYKIFDFPNHRKIHEKPVVRTGGLSIAIVFLISISIFFAIYKYLNDYLDLDLVLNNHLIVITFASLLFFLLGLIDDIFDNISAISKLTFEIIISIFLWSQGIKIESISFSPILNLTFDLPLIVSLIITIIWITGITNSINWLDGMDGLLSIFIINISLGFLIISNLQENYQLCFLCLFMMAIATSFFRDNFYRLKIFMGDSGSIFLGVLISLISIELFRYYDFSKSEYYLGSFNITLILISLSLPLFDMIRVILSRLSKRISPFYSDKNHFHHKLSKYGFKKQNIIKVVFIYTQFTSTISIFLASSLSLVIPSFLSFYIIPILLFINRKSSLKTKS